MKKYFISAVALVLAGCAVAPNEPRETRTATADERAYFRSLLTSLDSCIARLEKTMPDTPNGNILMGCDCIRNTFANYLDDDIVIWATQNPEAYVRGPTPSWVQQKAVRAMSGTTRLAYRSCGMKYE